MRFFPGKFHLYKGASTFVILQAQFLLLRRNAERIFATETRRHGERVSPTVLCGHGKKGHCSKLAEKNLVKLSLRAQRSNLVNGKGLLRRCAPRNDRLKGSLSVKLLQSPFLTPEMDHSILGPEKQPLIRAVSALGETWDFEEKRQVILVKPLVCGKAVSGGIRLSCLDGGVMIHFRRK